jgi:hypothetical protein
MGGEVNKTITLGKVLSPIDYRCDDGENILKLE